MTATAYTIRGTPDSQEWQSDNSDQFWVMGYISGRNAALNETLTTGLDMEEVYQYVTQFCQANPDNDADDALQAYAKGTPMTGATATSASSAPSGYKPISMIDLKLDIGSMLNQKIQIKTRLISFGGMLMLTDPNRTFDGNGILAEQDQMSRDDRAYILQQCGAGGDIAASEATRTKPDGYTLLMASVGPMAINPTLKQLKHDPLTELAPIILVADVPNVLVVNPSTGIKNFKDFEAFVKAKGSLLNYPSTGTGTSAHLSGFMLMQRMGIDATHIPYKGAEALNGLLAGQTDFMFATIPSVIGQIKAGTLTPIAVTSLKRSRSMPDIPTVQELGFEGYQAGSWFGLLAPTGTPQAIIDKVNADVNKILPALEQQFIAAGADPVGGPPKVYADFIMSEYTKWKKVIEDSGAAKK